MKWTLLASILCVAPLARAHFAFLVPEPGGRQARLILSETLSPDPDVDVALVGGAKLRLRDAAGKEVNLELKPAKDAYTIALAGEGARLVYGSVEAGVRRRPQATPHLLLYHPKTVVGEAANQRTVAGAPVELVTRRNPDGIRFEVLISGKPSAAAQVQIILPDGKSKSVVTGPEGITESFRAPGRYGAWTRHFEDVRGLAGDKPYEQIRHYATLVADFTPPAPSTQSALPRLPEAVSSFGAAACDGYLYVYGGHVARTHAYSVEAVSRRFWRLQLQPRGTWEELAGGPGLQGMNLAAHTGRIFRVGGMEPRNRPGEKADNFSLSTAVAYDPASGKWTDLPPLPRPRSSHDVVALRDKLYVIGGWSMEGHRGGNTWLDDMLVMDLSAAVPRWEAIRQPFERRALIAAAHRNRIYVIGGFTEESDPSLRVDVFDPETAQWSRGPQLPEPERNGFAPAACVFDGRLYASVGDGSLLRLDDEAGKWERVGRTTPRIVHRMIPVRDGIWVIGGADKGDNLDLIEIVKTPHLSLD